MDICESNCAHAQKSSLGTGLSPTWRLQTLCLDVTILQRQLVLVLTDEGRGTGDPALPLATARCIGARLAEGDALFRSQGVETPAIAAFRRQIEAPDSAAQRLRRGEAEGMTRDVLFAAGLFLTAAQQRLAATAPRHEPETSGGFDQQDEETEWALARIA